MGEEPPLKAGLVGPQGPSLRPAAPLCSCRGRPAPGNSFGLRDGPVRTGASLAGWGRPAAPSPGVFSGPVSGVGPGPVGLQAPGGAEDNHIKLLPPVACEFGNGNNDTMPCQRRKRGGSGKALGTACATVNAAGVDDCFLRQQPQATQRSSKGHLRTTQTTD